jgi:hypothetical protein
MEGFDMVLRQRVFFGVITVAVAALALAVGARAHDNEPSSAEVAFARSVSDLMVNELVAALFQEFNETTPENVPHGKQAIQLLFNDLNRDMRLIGAFNPLLGGGNNRPDDRFELSALRRALAGQPHAAVQQINDRWYYRRSVPLSNTLHDACVMCHTNFTPEFFANNPGQWVGALLVRVPIRTNAGSGSH